MGMRQYHDPEADDPFPYDRPHISSWVATAAVAFAIFVLGGFVKTYAQLETLRRESQREIRELRTMIEHLNTAASAAGKNAPRARSVRGVLLPRANRPEQSRPPAAAPSPPPLPEAPPRQAVPLPPPLPDLEERRGGITYEIGRRSQPQARREQQQIIAVGAHKRVIVEGGRDIGMEEGGRLELSRDGRWIGDLRIAEVHDSMSVCEVVHSTQAPRPGDVWRFP